MEVEYHTCSIIPTSTVWTQIPVNQTAYNKPFKEPPMISIFLYNRQYLDVDHYLNYPPNTYYFGFVFYPTIANIEYNFIWCAIGRRQ